MADFMGMMKQAQNLQAKMADMQTELEQAKVEGSAGGDAVRVTLSGKGQMIGVAIDPGLLKPDDREMLEDLIIAAHEDARRRIEALTAEKMQSVTAGLKLPPGMKLPF